MRASRSLSLSGPALVSQTSTSVGAVPAGIDASGAVLSELKRGARSTEVIGGKSGRISALDFTKGTLVLVMVLYHWLNYFVGAQGSYYRYLSFLPPSFICITGFLISQVYFSKYRITDARLPRRLTVRGLKLLVIFISLNLGISLLITGPHGARRFDKFSVRSLESIFVTGNMAGGRMVAFYVLVPIGYLLLLSACMLIAYRAYKYVFHAMTALCLLANLVLDLNGLKSVNLELLTIGLLGISIGYIPLAKVNYLLRYPFAVFVAYLCYTAAITVWDAPYPLQVAGVLLTLALIYLVGSVSGEGGRMQRSLILLGKYSLLGYIAQIAILQVLRRGLQMYLPAWALLASFVAAVALTLMTVEAVNRARAKAAVVNRLYAAVFS